MLNFIFIFIYLIAGYIFSKTKFANPNIPNFLNKFVIYISLPAMILLQIPKLSISMDSMIPVVISWSVMFLSVIIVHIACRAFNFSKEITGALLLVAVFGNTSFLGIPVVSAYYGQEMLPYVIVYDQLGTFLALATYGTFVVSYYSSEAKLNVQIILKKLFTFPPFVFLIIAFMLQDIKYTPAVEYILGLFGATIVPLAVTAVGMQLQLKLPPEYIKPFSVSLIIKLIIAPILAFVICTLLGWDGEVVKVTIMEAGMGPMITAGAMASMAGLAPRLSSAILGYGITIAFATTYIIYLVL